MFAVYLNVRVTSVLLVLFNNNICLCVSTHHNAVMLLDLGGKGGLSALDLNRAVWQKISRKGDFPSTRCGSAIAMYKSKALLFGGVFDEEGTYYAVPLYMRLL